ncbi:MAG TPA: sugar MFS transporter [Candidatus Acidoferrales bacterium]|jgi:FHS family L-fucose permease-like MFS transporter|nr:sugar MFS transporter [Candidatus Acidoferrales bacterium]
MNPADHGYTAAAAPPATQRAALALVTALFFIWGFLTELNDVLVPHLKSVFDLNYFRAMLVQFAFFSAYFLFSVPWAKVINWTGYQKTMVAGLLTSALGAFLFIPAANVPSYPLFLAALMVLAAGITALQVAANAYVAVLGPPKTASSRLNLTQAVNSLGHTTAPWVGGLLILSVAPKGVPELRQMSVAALQSYQVHEASSVKLPYMFIGLVLFVLGVSVARFKLPPMPGAERHGAVGTQSLWQYPHLILGVIGIFLYVGAEVSIGGFLVNYFVQPEIGNVTAKAAARLVSFYWGCAMVGRFIGSAILQKARTGIVLGIAAIAASLLVSTSMLTFGTVAMWSIILVGLFNSVMFPSIFTLGIAGLGPLTGEGSGLLIMAIVGGAIVPVLQGALADRIGIHYAFILPAACYLYIVFYALKGSKPAPAL